MPFAATATPPTMPNVALPSRSLQHHAAAAAVKAVPPHHHADAVTALHTAAHHATAATIVGTAALPCCRCCGKPREEEASVSENGIDCQQRRDTSMLALLLPMLPVLRVLPMLPGPPNPPSPPHPFACSHLCSACVSTTALAHAAPKSSLWGRSAEELVLRRSRGGKARRAEEGLG
ncbi:unnamed protein product [Closterium sp. NIES-65]|nr:unnamed protein product [Closterium sp. NIES-65]